MIQGKNHASPDRKAAVKALHRTRPRSRLLRATLYVLAAVVAYSWLLGGLSGFDLFTARRARNLQRFFHEATPFPLQDRSFDAGVLFGWIRDLLAESGWHAALVTVAIASAATVLAGVLGWIAAGPAARVLATPDPYLESRKSTPLQRGLWRSLVVATRGFLIVLRAIPEYVWAFLLLAILGPGAWPAVLALGLHNAGILGRLQAEVIENSDHAPFAAARA
ncbi:MAG: PhnE/PtxC family ABC transporter permease, partial [Planctomycetota bacterium]